MARDSMTDWLGQTVRPDDYVTYAVMSGGRSAEMCLGQIVSLNDSGTVTVRGIKGAKGSHYYGRVRYRDNRTGKGIDPYHNDKHVEKLAHWTHPDFPGVEFDHDQMRDKVLSRQYGYDSFAYHSVTFKDYVELVKDPDSMVTLNKNAGVRTITKVPAWLAEWKGTEESDEAPEA